MEDVLRKALNLGIGAVKTFQEKYGDSMKNFEGRFEEKLDEFIKKGDAANDEVSNKVKDGLESIISFVNQYQSGETDSAKTEKSKTTKGKKSSTKKSTSKKAEASA